MAGESWVSNISISDRHSSDDLTNKIGIYLEIEFKVRTSYSGKSIHLTIFTFYWREWLFCQKKNGLKAGGWFVLYRIGLYKTRLYYVLCYVIYTSEALKCQMREGRLGLQHHIKDNQHLFFILQS